MRQLHIHSSQLLCLFEFSVNVFTEFCDPCFVRLSKPATSRGRDQDITIQPARHKCNEQDPQIDPNSCFTDLSDSMNSLNSLNSIQILFL